MAFLLNILIGVLLLSIYQVYPSRRRPVFRDKKQLRLYPEHKVFIGPASFTRIRLAVKS